MVASARTWAANPASCTNDVDCTATPQCGGDVCTYTATATTCTPAGTGPKGSDGWCTVDTDCKCYAEGARCSGVFCTFTKAGDAPGAGGKGGSSGVAGNAGGGGASGGAQGPSAGAGGTSPSNSGSGGCAVAGAPPAAGGLVLAVLGLIAMLAGRRVRRL